MSLTNFSLYDKEMEVVRFTCRVAFALMALALASLALLPLT